MHLAPALASSLLAYGLAAQAPQFRPILFDSHVLMYLMYIAIATSKKFTGYYKTVDYISKLSVAC